MRKFLYKHRRDFVLVSITILVMLVCVFVFGLQSPGQEAHMGAFAPVQGELALQQRGLEAKLLKLRQQLRKEQRVRRGLCRAEGPRAGIDYPASTDPRCPSGFISTVPPNPRPHTGEPPGTRDYGGDEGPTLGSDGEPREVSPQQNKGGDTGTAGLA